MNLDDFESLKVGDRLGDHRNDKNFFVVIQIGKDNRFIVMENQPSNGHKHLVADLHAWRLHLYKVA